MSNMANMGGIIAGVLIIGAAVMYMGSATAETPTETPIPGCIDAVAINYNPNATVDNGSCTYRPGDSPEEQADEEEEEEEQEEWDSACNDLWTSRGERKNNKWHKIFELSDSVSDINCDVIALKAIVYSDKELYVQGEPITLLIFKKYGENETDSDYKTTWHKWGASSSLYAEPVDFRIGVRDNDETIFLQQYGRYLPSASFVSKGTYTLNGDLTGKSNLWDTYSVVKLVLSTTNVSISEPTKFTVDGKIKRNFIDNTWPVGNCTAVSDYKKKESAFKIYPAECGTYSSEAESYDSEWSQSHQSFMSEWV